MEARGERRGQRLGEVVDILGRLICVERLLGK